MFFLFCLYFSTFIVATTNNFVIFTSDEKVKYPAIRSAIIGVFWPYYMVRGVMAYGKSFAAQFIMDVKDYINSKIQLP
jgi:hypothetical protein